MTGGHWADTPCISRALAEGFGDMRRAMKGTIVKCIEELVIRDFGAEKWKAALKGAGFNENAYIATTSDYADGDVMKLLDSVSKAGPIGLAQLIEAFGDYWSTTYAPGIYGVYFEKAKCAKDLLLNLDHIHTAMTKSMKGAAPPHFRYEWENPKVLIMHYDSPRGMVAFMPALIRGVAKYYKEKVVVNTTGNSIRVQFS
jgi:hypothetical protein